MSTSRKFDTCFFERYAQITLETCLGPDYAALVNEDRPDLQMPDRSLGIEVSDSTSYSGNKMYVTLRFDEI